MKLRVTPARHVAQEVKRLGQRIHAYSAKPTPRSKHMKHPSFTHHRAASLVMQGLQGSDHFLITGEPEQAIYLGS
ncbi:hypothetical protein ACDH53_05900 [Pseudomonas tremae]|uniref:Uncharacterized protein n=1 Tax=Pseudomonas tremae TaxID=200454 RepID=A0ABV4PA65_9PSED|nr:hypothetical protein [Pseudomonas coronafaciens]